jgi:hypothetical protein
VEGDTDDSTVERFRWGYVTTAAGGIRTNGGISMGERGAELFETADRQISELIGLLTTRGHAALNLPCPGRAKLGDGTVGATASHTADSYFRIAGFLQATVQGQGGQVLGGHGGDYTAENVDLEDLLGRLSAALNALSLLTDLRDEQFDVVPPASDMKFCDGHRTLEQVVNSLLNHQGHQIDALKAAVA